MGSAVHKIENATLPWMRKLRRLLGKSTTSNFLIWNMTWNPDHLSEEPPVEGLSPESGSLRPLAVGKMGSQLTPLSGRDAEGNW